MHINYIKFKRFLCIFMSEKANYIKINIKRFFA